MTDNSLIGPLGSDSGCYIRTPQKLAIVISFVAGSLLGAVATILIQVLIQQLILNKESKALPSIMTALTDLFQKLLAEAFPDWLSSASVFVLVSYQTQWMTI